MLTYLNASEQETSMVSQFGGYNHKISISESEFYDMKNMSGKDFPLASTRKKRKIINSDSLGTAQTLTSKDNLLFTYTGYGEIGVNLVSDVPKTEWQDPTTGEAEEKQEVIYTELGGYNDNDLTRSILGSNMNVSNFGRYKAVGSSMITSNGKAPVIIDGKLMMEWEHEAIPQKTLWAKRLFVIKNKVGFLFPKRAYIDSYSFLENEANRNLLIGKTLWLNADKTVKIAVIEKSALLTEKWVVEFEEEVQSSWEGKGIYVRLSEPLPNQISAGKYTEKEEDGEITEINKPTEVEVTALTDMHIKVLKGQTISFADGNGEHKCKVVDYKIENGKKYLYFEVGHDAISAGATANGNRLYLGEINPEDGSVVTSDIFSASEGKHMVLEMGAKVIIFPEKISVNTQIKNAEGQYTEIVQLEKTEAVTGTDENKVHYRITDANGNNIEDPKAVQNTAPTNPANKDSWLDTSTEPPTMKIYSSQIEQWAKVQTYCELSAKSMSGDWDVGDAVELEAPEIIFRDFILPGKDQKYYVISAVGKKNVDGVEESYIRFPVTMRQACDSTSTVTIKRTIPDMDFVIENENRLWGCKYGMVDGNPINEIFACKLGDEKNWHHFTNTAMDSYYVNLGADGEFTGAVSYKGNPFFFREGGVHRITGNFPSNYALQTVECHGVEKGSDKGIAVMNDVMFYKSPVGIMAYTGASPVNMSANLGDVRYKNAVAGAVGNKMYFSMVDKDGNNVLFCFDDSTKLWYKEDDLRCKEMVTYDNEVYALSENNQIIALEGGNQSNEEDFEWFVESGNFGYYLPFYKRLSKLNLKLEMELGTNAKLSIQHDSDGNWHHITNLNATGKVKSVTVPINPQRCDHFALKIEGKGACRILSITKYIEGGSDDE